MNLTELETKTNEELAALAKELGVENGNQRRDELVIHLLEAFAHKQGIIAATGLLEIMGDGYGFLRQRALRAGAGDVYISQSQIRRFGLRTGDQVTGHVRSPKDGERYFGLIRVEAVNGMEPDRTRTRISFDNLTPVYPTRQLTLETRPNNLTQRVIDVVAPIGRGQRALIVSPPKAGKTFFLKDIANGITSNHPDVDVMVVLAGERPEEVTDIQRSVRGEVFASTFDDPVEDHCRIAEVSLERAKRLVEAGKHVVLLLDSLTRLVRAYNLALPSTGRTLSGGIDPAALYPPKRFFGAARSTEDGGSLTIVADVPHRHGQPHGRGDLRGVQGHGQLRDSPGPPAGGAAGFPGHRHPAQQHAAGGAAVRADDAQAGVAAAPHGRHGVLRGGRRRVQRRHGAGAGAHEQEQDQQGVPDEPGDAERPGVTPRAARGSTGSPWRPPLATQSGQG